MNREQLKVGDYIQSNSGKLFAHVDKILEYKIRVIINGEKAYIFNDELKYWSYANPIKDNRIVSSKTFAIRFKDFIANTNVNDAISEEEKEYLLMVANELLNYQIQTAVDEEEINYLKRLNLL